MFSFLTFLAFSAKLPASQVGGLVDTLTYSFKFSSVHLNGIG